MIGRRLPDRQWPDSLPEKYQAGDFWKVLGSPHDGPWYICAPEGSLGAIGRHVVEEHEDGMITVANLPDQANSILIVSRGETLWHGFINHGVWESV